MRSWFRKSFTGGYSHSAQNGNDCTYYQALGINQANSRPVPLSSTALRVSHLPFLPALTHLLAHHRFHALRLPHAHATIAALTLLSDDALTALQRDGLLTRQVAPDALEGMRHAMPALIQRINTYTGGAAEKPQDPHADPPGEERLRGVSRSSSVRISDWGRDTNLAKHIPAAVHGHGPQHEQADGHEGGEGLGDEGGAGQHGGFLDGLLGREAEDGGRADGGVVPVGDGLRIDVLGGGDGGVVAEAD